MKTTVIYFSQTGNTQKIAKSIQKGIADVTGQCDIVRIQDAKREGLVTYDLIGLGSPVWHRREPSNVLSFIEYTLRAFESKLGFVFCTHGLYPGHFIGRMVPALTLEGFTMIGWRNWYAGCWVPEHPKPYFTDGHPDEMDLAEAESFGKEMAERGLKVMAGEPGLIPALPSGRQYHELYPGPGSTDRADRKQAAAGHPELIDLRSFSFRLNREKCLYPKCTLCIDNCPTGSINLSLSTPIFRHSCDRCWFCEQICPRGAIEVDWQPIAEFVDRHIADGWEQIASEAAATGKLRRLVKPEEIGRKTPWHTRKLPRLKPLK